MTNQDDFYTPEQVDEQLEVLLQAKKRNSRDLRLIEGLHSELLAQSEQIVLIDKDEADVLARVHSRLCDIEGRQRLYQQNTLPLALLKKKRPEQDTEKILVSSNGQKEYNGSLSLKRPTNTTMQHARRSHRFLTLLVAVFLVGILVSSFLAFIHFQRYQTTKKPTSYLAQETPGIYYTTTDHVIKLDKQSGKILWDFQGPTKKQETSAGIYGWENYPPIVSTSSSTLYFTRSLWSTTDAKTYTSIVYIYAINTQDGSVRWTYTSPGDMAQSSAILSGDHIYLPINAGTKMQKEGNAETGSGGMNNFLLALDQKTGQLLWRTPLKGGISGQFFAANNLVYVDVLQSGSDYKPVHSIEALHTQNGTEAWTASLGDIDIVQIYGTKTQVFLKTTAHDRTVISALDTQSGARQWDSDPILRANAGHLVLNDGKIYLCVNFEVNAAKVSKIVILDPSSGKQLQEQDANLPLELYDLIVDNGHLYITYSVPTIQNLQQKYDLEKIYSVAGVLALDGTTYNRIWIRASQSKPFILFEDGKIYEMVDGGIEKLDATNGNIIWQQDLSTSLSTTQK